ncbi:MAG TPA: hypothetical protein VNX01_13145 [Bacteroidia bacterium]|jgi:hypothetical protein|nr:hypothetical protein [Bacteroidia bacterium]
MKKTIISVSVLLASILLTVTSCKKGDTGPTGAMGATGTQGAAGPINPLDAPRTSADRFSAAAGHLMVRDSPILLFTVFH